MATQDRFFVFTHCRHETTRTNKRAAEDDVKLFTEILGRKAWIQETPFREEPDNGT